MPRHAAPRVRRIPLLALTLSASAGLAPLAAGPAAALPSAAPVASQSTAPHGTFLNPIAAAADPWVVAHEGWYYWCFTEANRGVAVYRSDRLTNLGEKHVVWHAPETGPYSRQIWAPELHRLDGRWYIYVAASDGKNENHRMIALESAGDDPLGPYAFRAELYTGDHINTGELNRWAIDGTILEHGGGRFFVWSGWEDHRDIQWLYLAPMSNPWTVSGNRIRLCANDDHVWERVGENPRGRGLNEAPQVLQHGGRTFIVFSASGAWQPTYKLGLLSLRPGGDPTNPRDWIKHPEPVFQPTGHVWGPGHNCFARSPDGTENWLVYHVKTERTEGWKRAIHLQPFRWRADGTPDFGQPLDPRLPVALPSGERRNPAGRRSRQRHLPRLSLPATPNRAAA
jgi:GH43 family beta-xylosidase